MKRIIIFISLAVISSVHLNAQIKYDYNWLFGWATPPHEPDSAYGMNLNFISDSVDIATIQINMAMKITSANMSDSTGQFLFYTNGCSISNYLGETMENGDSINPGEVYDIQCPGYTGSYTIPNGVLIIPKHGSLSEYYVFHQGLVYTSENGFSVRVIPLYVTTVDMTYNNGLGKVTQKNQVVINDTLHFANLDAVRHENGIDWWIVSPREEDGAIYTLLVKSDTIEGPYVQEVPLGNDFNNGGQSVFSPDGTRYVQYRVQDGIYIHVFDRSTGLASNGIYVPLEEPTVPGGCAISPNSRFLYVNTWSNIYQFDLEADDIGASKILVAEYNGYQSPFPTSFYKQRLGPDCRIYINSPNGVDVLHVIMYPDRPGLACEVVQHGVQLPYRNAIGIPNFPHYRTGTPYPVCDSTIVLNITTPVFDLPAPEVLKLSLFPNPASEQVTIRLTEPVSDALTWRLFDALGREVAAEVLVPYQEEASINVQHLPKGIYFYNVEQKGVIAASGKVVVGR